MFNLNDSDSSFYSYEEIELPQPNALLDSHHSLEPDIMMGWRPKIGLKTPIYLCFDEPLCDDFINTMINIRVGA